jgi:hypothetical protein
LRTDPQVSPQRRERQYYTKISPETANRRLAADTRDKRLSLRKTKRYFKEQNQRRHPASDSKLSFSFSIGPLSAVKDIISGGIFFNKKTPAQTRRQPTAKHLRWMGSYI